MSNSSPIVPCPVSGYGSFTFPNGDNYTGEWANSNPHGRGKMVSWGSVYEGNFRNGVREGKGVTRYSDGASYDGEYRNDNRDGTGVFKWGPGQWAGDVFEGRWRNDVKDGAGVIKFANGNTYVGSYKNGLKEGKGVATFAVDGKTSLRGLSTTWNAGDVYDGEWRADRRHGACRYTFFNGEVYACTFVDGVCGEFDARQDAVRAAPDAASAQARAEGYASAAAKEEAEAAEKAEAIKFSHVTDILQRLGLVSFLPAFK
jgi:hypothetical protein